jgi:hypothetical protein
LDCTEIGDKGLTHLSALKQLTNVNLVQTNVTPAGVARFKKAVPACQVSFSYGLGLEPKTVDLWIEGEKPSIDEFTARTKKLGDIAINTIGTGPNERFDLRIHDSQISDKTAKDIVLALACIFAASYSATTLQPFCLSYRIFGNWKCSTVGSPTKA